MSRSNYAIRPISLCPRFRYDQHQQPMTAIRLLAALLLVAAAPSAERELEGSFSALHGQSVITGAFTARLDAEADIGWGTWRTVDAAGKRTAAGTWAVRKIGNEWRGSWRARGTGQGAADISGTWTASSDLPVGSAFNRLLQSAVSKVVSGSWASGANKGTWSIRTR